MRRESPVTYFEPTNQWLIARHADVNALLRDRRLGRSYLHVATHEEFGRPPEPEFQEPFWRVIRAGMLDVEPPVHTRLRRLVSKAFTPRMVESLRPRVRSIARELVDAYVEKGGGDLIAEVAVMVPARLTPRERELFSELANVSAFDPRRELPRSGSDGPRRRKAATS